MSRRQDASSGPSTTGLSQIFFFIARFPPSARCSVPAALSVVSTKRPLFKYEIYIGLNRPPRAICFLIGLIVNCHLIIHAMCVCCSRDVHLIFVNDKMTSCCLHLMLLLIKKKKIITTNADVVVFFLNPTSLLLLLTVG